MSNAKFISRKEAAELTSKGLKKWDALEESAIASINAKIREAASAGRSNIILKGSILSYNDGPVLDRHGTSLVMSPRMLAVMKEDGYEVTNPHVGFQPDDKGGYEVDVMISWRKSVAIEDNHYICPIVDLTPLNDAHQRVVRGS
jgi:hypothetical protein